MKYRTEVILKVYFNITKKHHIQSSQRTEIDKQKAHYERNIVMQGVNKGATLLSKLCKITAKDRIFFSITLLNPFSVLLNNNNVRPITEESVQSER